MAEYKKKKRRGGGLLFFIFLAVVVFVIFKGVNSGEIIPPVDIPGITDNIPSDAPETEPIETSDPVETSESAGDPDETALEAFMREHDLTLGDYPDSLLELLERNPETEEFVLNYPLLKRNKTEYTVDEFKPGSVPYLMQWDSRWGYKIYGDDVMGITGCGPTCLSMVAMYIKGDTKYDPAYVAEFSEENGYCVYGNGTAWALMSDGAEKLGLDVTEIPLDENRIISNLKEGHPIICIMGPGAFTTSGHYIVMVGYEDGKIKVYDPNRRVNSEKLWDFDEISDQIRNIWVYK